MIIPRQGVWGRLPFFRRFREHLRLYCFLWDRELSALIRRRQYARLTSRMRKIITNGNSLPRKRTRLFGTMQSIYRTVKSKGIKKLQAGNSNNRMTMARKSPILLSKFLFINRKSPWSFILSVVSDSFSVFSFLPYPANDATVRKSVKKANRYFCSFSCSTLFQLSRCC